MGLEKKTCGTPMGAGWPGAGGVWGVHALQRAHLCSNHGQIQSFALTSVSSPHHILFDCIAMKMQSSPAGQRGLDVAGGVWVEEGSG